MRHFFPYPLFALGLLAMWLLLTQSLAAGQIALGTIVAFVGTRAMAALQPVRVHMQSIRPIPRLFSAVIADVVRSNIAVARIVCLPSRYDRNPGFVIVPLELRNRYGLTILALIITATPGTFWAGFNRKTDQLLVHVLDLEDEDAWIEQIKHRYERPLMEIFE